VKPLTLSFFLFSKCFIVLKYPPKVLLQYKTWLINVAMN